MNKKILSDLIDVLEESIKIIKNEDSDLEQLETKVSEINQVINKDEFKTSFNEYKKEKRIPLKTYIDKCISENSDNKLVVETLKLLPDVISLTKEEKIRVVEAVHKLDNEKLSELIKIFKEEKIKFKELEKEYGDDVKKLKQQRLSENEGVITTTKK